MFFNIIRNKNYIKNEKFWIELITFCHKIFKIFTSKNVLLVVRMFAKIAIKHTDICNCGIFTWNKEKHRVSISTRSK